MNADKDFEVLLRQVQTIVQESGNPHGFDSAVWLRAWMSSPVPALGGVTPADYMKRQNGREMISNLLAAAQSGAFL
jgi:hypothetical protein